METESTPVVGGALYDAGWNVRARRLLTREPRDCRAPYRYSLPVPGLRRSLHLNDETRIQLLTARIRTTLGISMLGAEIECRLNWLGFRNMTEQPEHA